MNDKPKRLHLFRWIFLVLIIGLGIWIVLNRQWLYDYYRGMTYQPSSEMIRIRDDLGLTNRGEFLFNASQPELDEATDFNNYCRDGGESEVAVLGCYAGGNIYIYNITDERLNGIRELTSAHELLHANWARMSDNEKTALAESLTRTFEANQEILDSELNNYNTDEKQEELYVRAGTEIADLPSVLEQHYAEIFKNQDKIVGFYDSYISVFRNLELEINGLKTEMEEMNARVEAKMAEYERRVKQLDANVTSFNSCASVAGCFKTEQEFSSRRAELIAEQEALRVMYDEINDLINLYNAKVEIYNADVMETEKLNTIINSSAKPRGVE